MVFRVSRTFLWSMLIAAPCVFVAQAASEVITITSVDEYTKHFHGTKPVIAMFTATWCGPCKQTKPHFIELAKSYSDVTFCLLDYDNKDFQSIYPDIKGIPTFVLSYKGQVIAKIAGGRDRTQLQQMVNDFKADVTGQKRTSPKSAPALTAQEYYKKGQERYRAIVAVCEKKDFDSAALEELMMDPVSMELFQAIAASDPTTEAHKQGFESIKSYFRGAKSSLETYKPQRRNPQDAFIKYGLNSIDLTLASPDYATYMARQMKIMEIYQKKMKLVMWEIFADIDFNSL